MRTVSDRLHSLLEPVSLTRVLKVHVFDPNRFAVGLLERRNDLPERRILPEECGRAVEGTVKVLIREPETGNCKKRMLVFAPAQWIQAG